MSKRDDKILKMLVDAYPEALSYQDIRSNCSGKEVKEGSNYRPEIQAISDLRKVYGYDAFESVRSYGYKVTDRFIQSLKNIVYHVPEKQTITNVQMKMKVKYSEKTSELLDALHAEMLNAFGKKIKIENILVESPDKRFDCFIKVEIENHNCATVYWSSDKPKKDIKQLTYQIAKATFSSINNSSMWSKTVQKMFDELGVDRAKIKFSGMEKRDYREEAFDINEKIKNE
mgnify:CR=1 FL=1